MPTTATYSHYIGFAPPLSLRQYSYLTPFTVTDNTDLTAEGDVAINATMSWSTSSTVTLIGVTDAGYPVVERAGYYCILANSGSLSNTPLVINVVTYTMCCPRAA